jgi:hypothetical protein
MDPSINGTSSQTPSSPRLSLFGGKDKDKKEKSKPRNGSLPPKFAMPEGSFSYTEGGKAPSLPSTPSKPSSSPDSPRGRTFSLRSILPGSSSQNAAAVEPSTTDSKVKSAAAQLEKAQQKQFTLNFLLKEGCAEIVVKYQIFKTLCKQFELETDPSKKRTLAFEAGQCVETIKFLENQKGGSVKGVYSVEATDRLKAINTKVVEQGVPLSKFKTDLLEEVIATKIKSLLAHEDAVTNFMSIFQTEINDLAECQTPVIILQKIDSIRKLTSKIKSCDEFYQVLLKDSNFVRLREDFEGKYSTPSLDQAFNYRSKVKEPLDRANEDDEQTAFALFNVMGSFKALEGLVEKDSQPRINEIILAIYDELKTQIETALKLTKDEEKLKRALLKGEEANQDKQKLANRWKIILSKEIVVALLYDEEYRFWDVGRLVLLVLNNHSLKDLLGKEIEFQSLLSAFFEAYLRFFQNAYEKVSISKENRNQAFGYALDAKLLFPHLPKSMQESVAPKMEEILETRAKTVMQEIYFSTEEYVNLLDRNLLFLKDQSFLLCMTNKDTNKRNKIWQEYITPYLTHRDLVARMRDGLAKALAEKDELQQIEKIIAALDSKSDLIISYAKNTPLLVTQTSEMTKMQGMAMPMILDWYVSPEAQETRKKAHPFIGIKAISQELNFAILPYQRFVKFPLMLDSLKKLADTSPDRRDLVSKITEIKVFFEAISKVLNASVSTTK